MSNFKIGDDVYVACANFCQKRNRYEFIIIGCVVLNTYLDSDNICIKDNIDQVHYINKNGLYSTIEECMLCFNNFVLFS